MRRAIQSPIPSNRLSHGLTSRFVAEARKAEVATLAAALIGDGPSTPAVVEAAEALAEAMLSLRAIRRAKHELLLRQPSRPGVQEVLNLIDHLAHLASGGEPGAAAIEAVNAPDERSDYWGLRGLLNMSGKDSRRLATIEDYERKAHSLYRKRVTRLDHAMIEAQRRR